VLGVGVFALHLARVPVDWTRPGVHTGGKLASPAYYPLLTRPGLQLALMCTATILLLTSWFQQPGRGFV